MKYLMLAAIMFMSCGTEYRDRPVPAQPAPAPQPGGGGNTGGGGGEPTNDWADIKPVINEQCALSGCHAGARFLSSGRAFKASNSATLIANGRMPLQRSANYELFTPAKKARLLAYLNE